MLVETDLRNDTIQEAKLNAIICDRFGATKRTVDEYLNQLVLIDFASRDSGLIWLKK